VLLEGWSGSSAIGLDSKVLSSHLHLEETALTPVGTPRVSSEPVFFSSLCIFAPSNN